MSHLYAVNFYLSVINILHSCVFPHGSLLINIQGNLLKSSQATGEQLCTTHNSQNGNAITAAVNRTTTMTLNLTMHTS